MLGSTCLIQGFFHNILKVLWCACAGSIFEPAPRLASCLALLGLLHQSLFILEQSKQMLEGPADKDTRFEAFRPCQSKVKPP